MLKYLKKNKNIMIAAVGLFIVSMSVLLMFLNQEPLNKDELKTSVVEASSVKSHQEEERHYREVVKNEEDPIVVIGMNGLIDFSSADFAELTGYKNEQIKGQLYFSFINPEELSTFLSGFGKVIDTEKPVLLVGPYRFKDSSGNYRYQIGSLYPVNADGKLTRIAISIRDITSELQKQQNNEKPQPEKTEESNPGKKIRDEKENENNHLMADKLASNVQTGF